MNDSDLPPLQQLIPIDVPAMTMRCLSDDALRALQREAFKAGLGKAALALIERAGQHFKVHDAALQDECLRAAEVIRALSSSKPGEQGEG